MTPQGSRTPTRRPPSGGAQRRRSSSPRRPAGADSTVQRFAARARQRRWSSLRPWVVGLAVVATFVALWWVVYRSSALAVQRVTVTGTHRLRAAQVLDAAAVADGTPLASLDAGAVRRRVAALPAVGSVSVERSWPHGVRIVVRERSAVAVLHRGPAYWLVDPGGVAFWPEPAPPHGLPVIATTQADQAATRAGLEVVSALPPGIRRSLLVAEVPTPAAVTLRLRSGITVVWGDASQSARKALVLARLLAAQKGTTYDVSSPDVATVR